jgi:hypothetical protein
VKLVVAIAAALLSVAPSVAGAKPATHHSATAKRCASHAKAKPRTGRCRPAHARPRAKPKPAALLPAQPCRQFASDNVAASKCLLAQPLTDIDHLFTTLDAGPMPGWRKPAHGTFRCVWLDACGTTAAVNLLNAVVPLVWGGKTFFTDQNGGWLWNRPAPLENPAVSDPLDGNTGVLIGNVQYAPSYLDGKRAVTITYEGLPDAPITIGNTRVVSGAPDDCRTFQPNLWLCNAWYDFRPAAAPQRWAVFTLDFTNTNG